MGPIILCHAYEDKKVVRRVYDALQESGFEVWIDSESVFGEQAWEPDMADWLGQAACMLVFLSKNSVRKIGSTHHEFGQLIDTWKDMPAGTVYTIPVRINDCQIPDLLSSLHHIDLFEDDGLAHVIRSLSEDRAERGCDAPEKAQQPKADEQDNALVDFHVAVDGRGEVVDVPERFSDPPIGGDITTEAVEGDPRRENDA
jgi:hypothetical protein